MNNNQASNHKPIDKVKIAVNPDPHLLRDMTREIVEKHSVNRLDPNSLRISQKK